MTYRRLLPNRIQYIIENHPNDPHLINVLKRVRVEPEKECWFISEDWSNYTTIKKQPGHRYMFRVFNPDKAIIGKVICHKCDRPGCINPSHLFAGTNMDNFHDAVNKKRIPKGGYVRKFWKKEDNERNLKYVMQELKYFGGYPK